jgi:hypothetical protein
MLLRQAARPEDFIYLNYHIPNPDDTDSLYQDNRSEPQTRANSYGISQSVVTVTDGNQYFGTASGWVLDSLDKRSLIDPQFAIDLIIDENDPANASEDSLIVEWSIEALRDIPNPVIVHTLVIEEEITFESSVAYNVVKKMLPNAAGSQNQDFQSFIAGDQYSSRIEWPIDVNIYDGTQLAVVVFVQERTDGSRPGEIYQVAYQKVDDQKREGDVVSSIDEELKLIANSISVFPNPVQRDLHFLTNNRPGEGFNWKIVDQRGVELMADNFRFVNGEYTVDTSEIPNGIYYLIISAEDQPLSYEKLIIMHR